VIDPLRLFGLLGAVVFSLACWFGVYLLVRGCCF
jgi:hypothetical protein